MVLNPVSDGSVIGTGTLKFDSRIVGGVAITADGTNDATVTLQQNNSDGLTVFKLVTKSPIFIGAPINLGSQSGWFSVTGTGSACQFYEWVE